MHDTTLWTDATGEEAEDACACCGRPVYTGQGTLVSGTGELADYAYRWTEGHDGRFTLGICPINTEGRYYAGLAAVTCRNDGENLVYTVLEPEDAPWGPSATMGAVLTRAQLLQEKRIPDLFDLVDAIARHEPRLSSRILGMLS